MEKKKLLTVREYAKKCGCSHPTILTAIRNGAISEGYDEKTEKIDADKADMEWGIDFVQGRVIKELEKQGKRAAQNDTEDEEDTEPSTTGINEIKDNTKSAELFRLQLLFNTRLARIKLLEAEGKLVDKDKVYRKLFQFGQNLRQQLEALPDRIIDEMLSGTREEAVSLFTKEIHRILELSSKYENDFNTRDL